MRWIAVIVFFIFAKSVYSQDYKNDISVVQYSAEFVKDAELDLSKFREYNTYVFYMGKHKDIFKNDNIKYVPTLIIYQDGKEILRVESGINLKLTENTRKEMKNKLNELLENKF